MNKQQIIEKLAADLKFPKSTARLAVDTALDLIVESVQGGEKVTLTGFGTFEKQQRKAARRFNPQTRQQMTVPPKVVPKFRPGKLFKEALGKKI